MRKAYLLLLVVPSALIWACSGDDSGVQDGGSDATTDSPVTTDSGKDSSSNEAGNDSSTTDAGPDVQLTIDCLKPADCVDGGDSDAAYPPGDAGVVCCGSVVGNGSQNACQIEGASTTCKAPGSCATDFSGLLSCSSATVRFCTTNAECTETSTNPLSDGSQCCTANAGDAGSFHVCANSTIAAGSKGRITCP